MGPGPAIPKVWAVMRAEVAHGSVQITAAALPRCSLMSPSYHCTNWPVRVFLTEKYYVPDN
jgi:hypothetical protein